MRIRAAVLEEFGKPLVVQDLDLAPPKDGEVLVALEACGICHTDMYTAASSPGTVVTLFSPECGECLHCTSGRTNIRLAIREQQGRGTRPDGTTRLSRGGEPIRHFMGTSTFADHTVMPEIALAKVRRDAPLDTIPAGPEAVPSILEMTGGFGLDYTFEATGLVDVMSQAVEAARLGWGLCTILGVAGKGETLSIIPRLLITGRRVCGGSFGGARRRTHVPQLVDRYMAGEIDIDSLVSHHLALDDVNRGFEPMENQDGIRSVIRFR